MKETWQSDLIDSINTFEELERQCSLTLEEEAWRDASIRLNPEDRLRIRIPIRYFNLIDQDAERNDPIRLQVIPSIEEMHQLAAESSDPLAEDAYMLSSRLIRRYKSRALFLATDVCAMYCRHCFRRRFAGKEHGSATEQEVEQAARVLAPIKEIKELLISGGDPLTMSDIQIERMITTFQRYRPDMVIRIGTRIPVTLPSRITRRLVDSLHRLAVISPIFVMTQFNHPRELDEYAKRALAMLVDAGIPLFNQTVLLKGVNDDVDVLELLMNNLVASRVKPYYLFQGDLAKGTSHFRTSLAFGFSLEKELRRRLSGLAMPVYAVDLPYGGGKVPLIPSRLIRKEGDRYLFESMDGEKIWYTDVSE